MDRTMVCKSLCFFLCVFGMIGGWAQVENIPISKEVTVDRIYLGLHSQTAFSHQKNGQEALSTLRVGTMVSFWVVPEKLKIQSFGTSNLIEGQVIRFSKSYEAIFFPLQKMVFKVGVMATPTTELRPNPTTWQSQVETNAEASIVGGKPGAKIQYRFDDNLSVTYGIHYHDSKVVQHLKFRIGRFAIAGYFKENAIFMAARWDFKDGHLVTTVFENEINVAAIVPISKEYRLYSDMAYDSNTESLIFGEWGLRKHFPNNHFIKGFFSFGYQLGPRNFLGGLFIHI